MLYTRASGIESQVERSRGTSIRRATAAGPDWPPPSGWPRRSLPPNRPSRQAVREASRVRHRHLRGCCERLTWKVSKANAMRGWDDSIARRRGGTDVAHGSSSATSSSSRCPATSARGRWRKSSRQSPAPRMRGPNPPLATKTCSEGPIRALVRLTHRRPWGASRAAPRCDCSRIRASVDPDETTSVRPTLPTIVA